MCGQNHEGRKKSKQTHEVPNQGGQVARDGIVPVADVGKVQCRHHDFWLEALPKLMMRLLESVRKSCHVNRWRVGPGNPRNQLWTPRRYLKQIMVSARHEICGNFASTRLAECSRDRMMAVFRFRRRCRSTLKAESDEDVTLVGSTHACLSRARAGDQWSGRHREESENNLQDVLDRGAMYPHNRQFSTEGCPSG